MRIYLNAQFYDGVHRTRLLSLGLVSELGEWYRIVDDQGAVEHARKDPWIREHVLGRMPWDEEGRDWLWDNTRPDFRYVIPKVAVADDLLDFVGTHPEPEFWGWHAAYAFTAVGHLFGRITDLPVHFPDWCGELIAEWKAAGEPELPPRPMSGYHALEYARWARDVGELLKSSGS